MTLFHTDLFGTNKLMRLFLHTRYWYFRRHYKNKGKYILVTDYNNASLVIVTIEGRLEKQVTSCIPETGYSHTFKVSRLFYAFLDL